MKPEEKAFNYLVSKGWRFDNEKLNIASLKTAFQKHGSTRNDLANIAWALKEKGWFFYSLKDFEKLDEARKIYRNCGY